MARNKLVVAWLPNAGLGNKLYVWALGQYSAIVLKRDFLCFGWSQPKLGPILRGERSNRLYLSQFRKESLRSYLFWCYLHSKNGTVIDPELARISELGDAVVYFKNPESNLTPRDSFSPFRGHREELRKALFNRLTVQSQIDLSNSPVPIVGIHVRRGDFGNSDVVTKISSYCNRLLKVRNVLGWCVPAIVYSDGTDQELQELLSLECVSRAPKNADVVDLISLSRSLVLIGSRASTFSFWAEFLSDGIILRDSIDPHLPCRQHAFNSSMFEGAVSSDISSPLPDEVSQSLRAFFSSEDARRVTGRRTF